MPPAASNQQDLKQRSHCRNGFFGYVIGLSVNLLLLTGVSCIEEPGKIEHSPTGPRPPVRSTEGKRNALPIQKTTRDLPKDNTVRLQVLTPMPSWATKSAEAGSVHAEIRVSNNVVATQVSAQTLSQARQGIALSIVIVGNKHLPLQVAGARALVTALKLRDVVAISHVGNGGFKLVYPFSADTRGAVTALEHISNQGTEQKLGDGVLFYDGLKQSTKVFSGAQLPIIRHLVLIATGRDRLIDRPSRRKRERISLQRHLIANGVRLSAIGLGPNTRTRQQLAELATGTGGWFLPYDWTKKPPPASAVSVIVGDIASQLHKWWAFNIDSQKLKPGQQDFAVVLGDGEHTAQFSNTITIPRPSSRRSHFAVDGRRLPNVPLPAGIGQNRPLVAEARNAEKQGQLLKAGVLWHMATQTAPEDAVVAQHAHLAYKAYGKSQYAVGQVLGGGKPHPADVAIHHDQKLLGNIWKDVFGSKRNLSQVLWPRLRVDEKNSTKQDPGKKQAVHQVVLHRCVAANTRACLRRLILDNTATHFIISAAGKITQIADLGYAVRHHDRLSSTQISIHFVLPPGGAPYYINPTQPNSWRRWRKRVVNRAVNGLVQSGWGLTQAQSNSLVPLLNNLAKLFPAVEAKFPAGPGRIETAAALLEPTEFKGLMVHSNLSPVIKTCPGPGVDIRALNRVVGRWRFGAKTLDLESWLSDLEFPGRAEGAMARFAALGSLAWPLLREVAVEGPTRQRVLALRVLVMSGDIEAVEIMADIISTKPAENPKDFATQANILAEALTGLTAMGSPAQIPLVVTLLNRIETNDDLKKASPRMSLRVKAVSAIAAMATHPDHLSRLKVYLQDLRPQLRGIAVAAFATKGGKKATDILVKHLDDPDSWIRLIAALKIPKAGVAAVRSAHAKVGTRVAANALAIISPKQPVPETLKWFADADIDGKDALSRLFIQWKWPKTVHILAPMLSKANRSERALILHTLRTITGRDLGTTPAGWLRWKRPSK